MENIETKGYIVYTIIGSVLISFSYLIFAFNPLGIITDKLTEFGPNSTVYSFWKEPPFAAFIKIYMFNVTNPKEFIDGREKLKVNEVGPYVYKEILYNVNSTFNDNGTITFTPKRKLEFVREHSIGDPFVDRLLLPNVPLLGITGALDKESMLVKLGIASLSAYLRTEALLNLSVSDFLHGYEDPLLGLANNYLPSWIDFSRFGVLDRIMNLDNDSSIVTLNINPKIKMSVNKLLTKEERMQPFSIQKWDGSSGLREWGYQIPKSNETLPQNSKCSLIEGSFMGTLFPPYFQSNRTLKLYRRAFCRTIPIVFDKMTTTKDGFEAYTYRLKKDFLAQKEENIENSCFCLNDNCLLKGLGDLSPCYYGIPIALSQPHFLNSDPLLLQAVEGLYPEEEKHDSKMIIHSALGVPLQADLRIQINLAIPTTKFNPTTRPFNDLTIPLLWISVSLDDVPSNIKFYITLLYHVLPILQQLIAYSLIILAALLICGSALVIILSNRPNTKRKTFSVNYSQIPVSSLQSKLLYRNVITER
ncbi:hypothetical protein FQA39_LY02279 [Lamprigera yunnana]|nr:hypothetical protein FQA39_LY02279 [Lamprigera yunnana]